VPVYKNSLFLVPPSPLPEPASTTACSRSPPRRTRHPRCLRRRRRRRPRSLSSSSRRRSRRTCARGSLMRRGRGAGSRRAASSSGRLRWSPPTAAAEPDLRKATSVTSGRGRARLGATSGRAGRGVGRATSPEGQSGARGTGQALARATSLEGQGGARGTGRGMVGIGRRLAARRTVVCKATPKPARLRSACARPSGAPPFPRRPGLSLTARRIGGHAHHLQGLRPPCLLRASARPAAPACCVPPHAQLACPGRSSWPTEPGPGGARMPSPELVSA
jgi:hypothetical protein